MMHTFLHMRSDTKKNETSPIAQEPRVEGERQTAIAHVLTCHSVARLSSIALLSTSVRTFKYGCSYPRSENVGQQK